MDQYGGYYEQLGGGCHKNAASGRCKKYEGADADDCMVGPLGRCRTGKGLKKAYDVKLPATEKQLAALAKARAARAANVAAKATAKKRQSGGYYQQVGGYYEHEQLGGGCHKNAASGRCKQYEGEDVDDCMVGPLGRCRTGKGLKKAYDVKLPATSAQLAALTKARAARAAKAAAKKAATIRG